VKLSVAGLTLKVGAGVTVNVTRTYFGLPLEPLARRVTQPLYVPVARPVGSTDTLAVPAGPDVGVTDNH
jgi:hypothetical protein